MEKISEVSDFTIDDLKKYAKKLLDLSDNNASNIKYLESDHLGFMCLCFLSKQIDHMRSILALVPKRDAILVARSMIEGFCKLLWAAKKPKDRPFKWRIFACVSDWRLLTEKLHNKISIPPEENHQIMERLNKYGANFLTNKAKMKRDNGGNLPRDPYHKDWCCGKSVKDICEDVGGLDLYLKLYSPYSDWHHWGPSGLGSAIKKDKNSVIYKSFSKSDVAASICSAFQCLLQTLELTIEHLNMEDLAIVEELKNEFIQYGKKHILV